MPDRGFKNVSYCIQLNLAIQICDSWGSRRNVSSEREREREFELQAKLEMSDIYTRAKGSCAMRACSSTMREKLMEWAW